MIQLSANDPVTIRSYLIDKTILEPDAVIAEVVPAGVGNMNVTLKVTDGNGFPFILKQSRPFVARFPDIPAPVERIAVENNFLAVGQASDVLFSAHPPVIFYDPDNYVLLLGFLDGARDLSYVYQEATVADVILVQLGNYLSALHRLPADDFPENNNLRALNHAHVFNLPFRPDNGFPLEEMVSGLAAVAKPYQEDAALRAAAAELGKIYLSNGTTLVHGDFYPGSFMDWDGKLFVIDGEFAHPGCAEFDLGVLLAHLRMAKVDGQSVLDAYQRPDGFDDKLMERFQAVEIMRRLIGIAQVPVTLDLEERANLLEDASSVLLG